MPSRRLFITGGLLKGRTFESPASAATRPMSNKMKLAMHNSLGPLAGKTVLDVYGGSGALSFEAISHGADQVTVLERDKRVFQVLSANIKKLELSNSVTAIRISVSQWLVQNQQKFDLIIIDPPYDLIEATPLVELVGLLNKTGQAVISCPLNYQLPAVINDPAIKTKKYGAASLRYFQAE